MAEPSRGWSSRLRGTRRVGSLDLVAVLTVIAGARIAVSGEVHGVAQSRDWLVFGATTPPPDLTVNLINGTTMLSLSNGLIERTFTVTKDGDGLCTTEYRNIVSGQTFFRAISPEANLTLSTAVGCPPQYVRVANVDSVNPKTPREEWAIPPVTGRSFRLVFERPASGYQPFVSEFEFKIGGAWRKNTDTANSTIVVNASGAEATPQGGFPWSAFDGNISSMWDSVDDTAGNYWIDIDFGFNVTFDGLAITSELSGVPGQGYYWRPKSVAVQQTIASTDVCAFPYDVGGCLGQPSNENEFWTPDDWRLALTANPSAFRFLNYTTTTPTALYPWKAGTRHAPTNIAWPPTGVHLQLSFGPPAAAPASLAGLVVVVHYEMYSGLPTLRKWVTVHNDGAAATPVIISTLVMELLRAPNFAPERMTVVTQQANNPTPFDQQVKPETDQSFPGRTSQYWHFDPRYDQPNDAEIHVSYTYYTYLVLGYGFNTQYFDTGGANSTGPGAVLGAGDSFTSLSVRFVLHDSTDSERQGLGVRQSMMRLAPQVLENPITYMIDDITGFPNPSAPMRLAVTQAAATGHELVIVGFGAAGYCGLCNKQMLDPAWVAWFKKEVAFANSLGIEVSAYTLMQHNGWGEVVPPPEQALFQSGRGGVACMATDFHATYRANVLKFINQTGMGGLETDGQYEDYSCADRTGDHRHNGLDGGYSYQLQTTLDFNMALKGLGMYQTGADAYVFSGANKWNHADTDAFGHLPFWPRLTVGRMYIYDSTMNRVPASGQIGVNDLAASSLSCGAAGTPARLMCFDYALASSYAYGTIHQFRATKLWSPTDPDAARLEATISKWIGFFKVYRDMFVGGHLIHIHRPDSRSVEAVAYVRPPADGVVVRGILSVLNPTDEVIYANITLSLYYAGFGPNVAVTVNKIPISTNATTRLWSAVESRTNTTVTHTVGQEGAGLYDIVVPCVLPPTSYYFFSVTA